MVSGNFLEAKPAKGAIMGSVWGPLGGTLRWSEMPSPMGMMTLQQSRVVGANFSSKIRRPDFNSAAAKPMLRQ